MREDDPTKKSGFFCKQRAKEECCCVCLATRRSRQERRRAHRKDNIGDDGAERKPLTVLPLRHGGEVVLLEAPASWQSYNQNRHKFGFGQKSEQNRTEQT